MWYLEKAVMQCIHATLRPKSGLALAAGVASQAVPTLAVTSLALVFASGVSLTDTADGVLCNTRSARRLKIVFDIDLAHVLDADGDLEAIAVREDVVEKRLVFPAPRKPKNTVTGSWRAVVSVEWFVIRSIFGRPLHWHDLQRQ
jgi:hypothetical protein